MTKTRQNMTELKKSIKIAIINYPFSLQSSVFGMQEVFLMANSLCEENKIKSKFIVTILETNNINRKESYDAVLFPPSLKNDYYLSPPAKIKDWILSYHMRGSIICSACAGAFIIASTGLLNNREATTHWGLVEAFREQYKAVKLNPDKILINESDIITAGGMMSWIDLCFELVSIFTKPIITRQLGKVLVTDTGKREQSYYQSFTPRLNHNDNLIIKIQHKLQKDYKSKIMISELAKLANLTERTFLRRFVKATDYTPKEYLQRLRIQKICDQLENTNDSFENIVYEVGYEDVSSCRKSFNKIMGLSPREFRRRFVN